jgi:protein O-mannosyl-transferase
MNQSPNENRSKVMPGGSGVLGDRRTVRLVCLVLAAITLVVFGRTIQFDFVGLDDGSFVSNVPAVVNGLTVKGVARAFTHGSLANWDPLTTLSHMLDCQLYGLSAGGHHLTNVLLHTASVLLLFLALRRLAGELWPSAFVAALFAIHPLRVESVAWVSERKDVLSGLFFMLTLCAYARYAQGPPKLPRYLMVVLWFVLGLMSKAMLVTLPFVLLLLDYWPLGRFSELQQEGSGGLALLRSRVVLEKIPLLVLAAASSVLAVLIQGDAVQSLVAYPLQMRLANAVVSVATYIRQMFWPTGLAVMYPFSTYYLGAGEVLAAVALTAAISALVLRLRRTRPYLLAGWLWYCGMLVPVIGLIQVGGAAHADRYTYLPQIGLYVALTWLVAGWCDGRARRQMLIAGVAGLVLTALGVGAFNQTYYWRDSERLWRRDLACAPESPVARNGLGLALFNKGREDEAMAELRKALKLDPNFQEARNNLGIVLAKKGQTDEAIDQFELAIKLRPKNAGSHNNLGSALASERRMDEAIGEFRQALKLQPDYAQAQKNLELALSQTGQPEEPYKLGVGLMQQGRTDEAIAQFQAARKDPAVSGKARLALELIAWDLATSPDDAKRNGAKAAELAQQLSDASGGSDPALLATLAAAYAETGRFADATAAAARARELALAQTNSPLAGAIQEQLTVYQSGRAFRDVAPTNAPAQK